METEMKSTLQVINAMQAVGVIVRYAIGGAVGLKIEGDAVGENFVLADDA